MKLFTKKGTLALIPAESTRSQLIRRFALFTKKHNQLNYFSPEQPDAEELDFEAEKYDGKIYLLLTLNRPPTDGRVIVGGSTGQIIMSRWNMCAQVENKTCISCNPNRPKKSFKQENDHLVFF